MPCVGSEYEEQILYTYDLHYRSFEEARDQCLEEGLVLARPQSLAENEALRKFAEEHYPLPLSVKSNPTNKENWVR